MNRKLATNTYYRHFKDKWYLVIDIAIHSESGEKFVVYRPCYGEQKMYVRPYNMFIEEVPKNKENPTNQKYRFMSLDELNINIEDFLKEIDQNF